MSARSPLFAVALLLVAMTSIQASASLAKTLFLRLDPVGVTTLRLIFAALVLLAVLRPWRTFRREALGSLLGYGVAMGVMNLTIYLAMQRLPIGIAVGLEFVGPLVVAICALRRWLDLLWIALVVAGLAVLLPFGHNTSALDPLGTALALGAGACWAIYIVLGKRAGAVHGTGTVAFGATIGALVILPIGILYSGSNLLQPTIWPLALGLAMLSTAIPYALEMVVLTRLPASTFGTLMSLEPALGALSGWVFLGEILGLPQWFALACIIAASIGATWSSRLRPEQTPL